jgi:hypothetical protein
MTLTVPWIISEGLISSFGNAGSSVGGTRLTEHTQISAQKRSLTPLGNINRVGSIKSAGSAPLSAIPEASRERLIK